VEALSAHVQSERLVGDPVRALRRCSASPLNPARRCRFALEAQDHGVADGAPDTLSDSRVNP
jgi:hypothetical protein